MRTLPHAVGLSLLGGAPESIALVADERVLSYGELALRIEQRSAQLGHHRRLVMLSASNDLESVVTYLAALEGAHPILLVAPGDDDAAVRQRATLMERFDPDVIATGTGDAFALREIRTGSIHEFAPELALLVSTSGSTGSPKLVRLSRENLQSNASAIAEYLRLTPADRAATSLPMHYCFGLSVINSHLIVGASLVLTDRSVTDPDFWEMASEQAITSFAGVPYTFELLEAGGYAAQLPKSIRYLTQAGGRLAPEAIRRFARLGARRGFEFFVMYGQTEATARMAYVPAELAEHAAGAIGIPIPGGRLRIEIDRDAAEADGANATDFGELVYEGPNVMLGYAEQPEDLALGRTIHELRTGDLARQRPDGLFEIVGRRSRFVKVCGLRIDLDEVQRLLAADGIDARTASSEERLLVFVRAERFVKSARARVADLLGIPLHAIHVYSIAEFPVTASGKPDFTMLVGYAELRDRSNAQNSAANHVVQSDGAGAGGAGHVTGESVRVLYVELLGRPDATLDDSFAGLGGDSLSYVEASIRLENMLGTLPRDWPARSARELANEHAGLPATVSSQQGIAGSAVERSRTRRFTQRIETPAVLRAAAIVLIVATHADLMSLQGGAHLLLVVAGYNLARFQLAGVRGTTRVRRLLRSAAQIALPAMVWIGLVAIISGKYDWSTVLLVNNLVPGDGTWNEQWQFWFLEAAVWTMLGFALLFAVRPVERLERRYPWEFGVSLLVVALGIRFAVTGGEALHVDRYAAAVVLWCVVLGWVIARADTTCKRIVVSVATIVAVAGFFGEPMREAIVIFGAMLLIWAAQIRVPTIVVPGVRLVAGASFFIYLTHWVVYPAWEASSPLVGTLLSIGVGVVIWLVYRRAGALLGVRVRRVQNSAVGRTTSESAPA